MATGDMSANVEPLVVVGLMSGTSVDALDAAVLEIHNEADTLVARTLAYREIQFEPDLRARVHRLFDPATGTVDAVCEVNVLLGEAFASAAEQALRDAGRAPDLVASHGQTVWHQTAPGHVRSTLQIGEPSVLAERLGATVVADFRPRDIAAGGQGAPLSSWCDALLFGDDRLSRAVQNIGGIGNVTWLPAGSGSPLAFDTGPGNALVDHAVSRLSGGSRHFDEDGRLAAAGEADQRMLADLLTHPYFSEPPPKSTGRELFGAPFADRVIERGRQRGLSDADLVATLSSFTARSIADQYTRFLPTVPDEVVVGGGGVRNPTLMAMLASAITPTRVRTHEEFGIPSTAREAIYFALMGYEALHGRPNTLAACTGASHSVVMGKIVPGPNYRSLARRIAESDSAPMRKAVIRTLLTH